MSQETMLVYKHEFLELLELIQPLQKQIYELIAAMMIDDDLVEAERNSILRIPVEASIQVAVDCDLGESLQELTMEELVEMNYEGLQQILLEDDPYQELSP